MPLLKEFFTYHSSVPTFHVEEFERLASKCNVMSQRLEIERAGDLLRLRESCPWLLEEATSIVFGGFDLTSVEHVLSFLQNYNCKKRQYVAHGADRPECFCAFLILHVTTTAKNVLFSNQWLWVSDHELDLDGKDQIDIYNARGLLIETHGPIWFYGSSSEHSMLYNYQIANAKDVYLSMMQSETA